MRLAPAVLPPGASVRSAGNRPRRGLKCGSNHNSTVAQFHFPRQRFPRIQPARQAPLLRQARQCLEGLSQLSRPGELVNRDPDAESLLHSMGSSLAIVWDYTMKETLMRLVVITLLSVG